MKVSHARGVVRDQSCKVPQLIEQLRSSRVNTVELRFGVVDKKV